MNADDHAEPRRRVMVIGSGSHFLSGISYYTHHLALALRDTHDVSIVLMRRLVPARLYPGRRRIGMKLASFAYPPDMPVLDGVDWWGRGLARAAVRVVRTRPDVLVLQWWTGAVLHLYLVLAGLARLVGAAVVIEFHESQDVGEMRFGPARWYVDHAFPLLLRMASGVVYHSEFDRRLIEERHGAGHTVAEVLPHGPYDGRVVPDPNVLAEARPGEREILWFGVIRPFKGVEDLVEAFSSLTDEEFGRVRLTVVGETWEGWTQPVEAIRRSPQSERITLVNRYVSDEELAGYLARAHVVALPYRRSSSSGPLAMAMAHGLPVVVTEVGGLVEAAGQYAGALFVPPGDVAALAAALRKVALEDPTHHEAPVSWKGTEKGFARLFRQLGSGSPTIRPTQEAQ
jgi:glycosyltransferase involved in cell wall biosynthesis